MNRPHWDEIWMNIALEISRRSMDSKYKVGAIIVTDDNTSLLSLGYNGHEKGGRNIRENMNHGCSEFIHAENNALLHLNFNDQRKKKMYVTLMPCLICSKMIVNAQTIKEVIYLQIYQEDLRGYDILTKHGIIVRKYGV